MARSRQRSERRTVALDRIKWKGQESFRMLSYYFSIRWNFDRAGERVLHTLGDFAVPPDPEEEPEVYAPGLPPLYSLVRTGSGENRYSLLYGEGRMTSSHSLGLVLSALFRHVNAQTLRQSSGFLLIHAGSVSTPAGDGVLLPSRSGGGKTTLVTALVRAGFQFLSDEGGAVDPVSRMLYPYPRALILKPGHKEVFPDLCGTVNGSDWYGGYKWLHPTEIRPGAVGRPCPIRFVLAHEYRPEADTELIPLTPAEAAMELLTNALNLPRYRSRALPLVADVVKRARCYRMVTGNLNDAVRTVTELTTRRRRAATNGH